MATLLQHFIEVQPSSCGMRVIIILLCSARANVFSRRKASELGGSRSRRGQWQWQLVTEEEDFY